MNPVLVFFFVGAGCVLGVITLFVVGAVSALWAANEESKKDKEE